MVDTVQWILRFSYYYSRFLGVLNFEIDVETGLARVTRVASIYAALANGVLCSLIVALGRSSLVSRLWSNAGLLHEYLFLVVHGTRCFCVIATIVSRWVQRQELVRLVNELSQLAFRKPEVERMWRLGVIYKAVGITLSHAVQITFTLLQLWPVLTLGLAMSIMFLYTLTVLVNVIISHYFFAVLNVRGHYMLLNRDIQIVLHEIRSLENGHRKATFMIRCCNLADKLEDIARSQSEVQRLFGNITHIFGIQVICVALNSYMSLIASVYYAYSHITMNIHKHWNPLIIFLFAFQLFVYYADVAVTIKNVFDTLADHTKMLELLKEPSNFAPGLDERLETVIESFQLQLARNPLKASALGLYNMERTNVVAIASSLVTHSLVLVQYDLKNAIVSKAPSL